MKATLTAHDTEYIVKDTDSIDSETDMKGTITYINDDFLRISGFAKNELIGATHDIVCHPDMPPEVLEDMWRSLNAGRSWGGVIKNRCKNGGFYWVLANATPYRQKGQLVGITFVHAQPTRTQIEEAAAIYRQFRASRESSLNTNKETFVRYNEKPKPFISLTLIGGMVSLLLIVIGCIGFVMNQSRESMRALYIDKADQVDRIDNLLLQNQLGFSMAISNSAEAQVKFQISLAEQNITQINAALKAYTATPMNQEEKILIGRFSKDLNNFITDGLRPLVSLLHKGKYREAGLFNEELWRLYEQPLRTGIEQLKILQSDAARKELNDAEILHGILRNIAIA
ncbi:MAG: Tar ligand binding domain-containing protein, partial [Gallionella sp.]|nr:Tar ligand binding domain-containing protein [Gallionella sp.]